MYHCIVTIKQVIFWHKQNSIVSGKAQINYIVNNKTLQEI